MILFYCTAMEELAKKILTSERIICGRINWGKFPDGFPDSFIENVACNVDGQDVAFLASFDTPAEIFRQMSVIYALPRYGAKSFTIILPYFPTGTMERVEREGEVATAMTLARMLSAIECKEASLVIYDIHDLKERFYFRHPIIPKFRSAASLFNSARMNGPERFSKAAICFPDEGAWKRFGKIFDGRHILCHKDRLWNKRNVKIIEGDPKGSDVIIVDDLVMTGGTILECAEVLDRAGVASVSAYVTHAVFPKKSCRRMSAFPFANFWVTDSCPETLKDFEYCATNFKIHSLAEPIASMLLGNR